MTYEIPEWTIIDPMTQALLCPECRSDYSHIRKVFTRMGSDKHEAIEAYEGSQTIGCVPGRRSALVIQIDGECGHSWEIVIQQHKGNNFVSTPMIQRDLG